MKLSIDLIGEEESIVFKTLNKQLIRNYIFNQIDHSVWMSLL